MVWEEKEHVDPLGLAISREEFFIMVVDIAFGIYTRMGLVGFEFDCAVYVAIFKGFVKVATIAEDSTSWIPAVNVALLWVVGVGEEVH